MNYSIEQRNFKVDLSSMHVYEQFQRDGFLILEDFNSPQMCDALMDRALELASSIEMETSYSVFQTRNQSATSDEYFLSSGDRVSCFFEKDAFDEHGKLKQSLFQSLNKLGHAMHDLDDVYRAFTRSLQMKELVRKLRMDHYVAIQSMHIFKHARIGGFVDVHQDSTFLYTEPASCVGFWFALEDATIENGCLWAKAGGHKTTLRSRFKRREGGGTEMIELNHDPIEIADMQPLEVKKGACVVLHGHLPHYSQPNTSGRSRQAYAVHLIDPGAHYPADNWLRRDHSTLQPI
jgi:phytanoyl-CoA hydroxylase